VLAENVTILKQ